jgi:hypothetical protein
LYAKRKGYVQRYTSDKKLRLVLQFCSLFSSALLSYSGAEPREDMVVEFSELLLDGAVETVELGLDDTTRQKFLF